MEPVSIVRDVRFLETCGEISRTIVDFVHDEDDADLVRHFLAARACPEAWQYRKSTKSA